MANRVAVDNVEPDVVSDSLAKTEVKKDSVGAKLQKYVASDRVRAKAGKSMFSAFLVEPKKVCFQNQDEDEEIILLLRAHPVTNVPWLIGVFFLLLIPFIVLPVLAAVGALPVTPGATLVLTLLWFMGVFSFAFLKFLYWYFNVYIVTNDEIVDVDWYNLVNKAVSSAKLERVQDVTSKQSGVMAGVFDFGTVLIQTAGTETNFEFDNVPHPHDVAEEIQHIMEKEEVGKISVDSVGGGIR